MSNKIKLQGRDKVWFYRPAWYWHGLSTLVPVYIGNSEDYCATLMIGWTVTGRVIIGLKRHRWVRINRAMVCGKCYFLA